MFCCKCGTKLSDTARFCVNCAAATTPLRQRTQTDWKLILGVILGFPVVLLAVFALIGRNAPPRSAPPPQANGAPWSGYENPGEWEKAVRDKVDRRLEEDRQRPLTVVPAAPTAAGLPGSRGVLVDEAFLCSTWDAEAEVSQQIQNKDPGALDMFRSGTCFAATRGTAVLVLDNSIGGGTRVRIMDGPMYGRAGWVPNSMVRRGQ